MRLVFVIFCACFGFAMAPGTSFGEPRTSVRPAPHRPIHQLAEKKWPVFGHQSVLSTLNSALRKPHSASRHSLTTQTPIVFLGKPQQRVLRRAHFLAPGLVLAAEAVGNSHFVFTPNGRNLAKFGPDLYIAPYAKEKFLRQVFLLHSAGIRHNQLRPENIWVSQTGELQLGEWNYATFGGDLTTDLEGVKSVCDFLRRQVGMGE
ncbi:MAG: hypothetical protein V1754_00520 [Pseudomonadota bacterium]